MTVLISALEPIFRSAHLQLKPRTAIPEIRAEFFPFAGLTHTVRFREDRLLVRISDLFLDAPAPVLESLAMILLAKLYRRKADGQHHATYREFILRGEIRQRARLAKTDRGRGPTAAIPKGRFRNLDTAFDRLNQDYFGGLLERPRLSWSARRSRHILGRYDATHRTIFVSRLFDSPHFPDFVLDYILYHEMLHVKHPSQVRECRLVSHSSEFRADERRFLHYRDAVEWLRKI